MKFKRILYICIICALVQSARLFPASAQSSTFRFIVWGDQRNDPTVTKAMSPFVVARNPNFLLVTGDLCPKTGGTIECLDWFKLNYNHSGDLLGKSLPIRGNHDNGNETVWQGYFNMGATTTSIGATNYKELNTDLTYSFDFGNSHFVGIDLPQGNANSMTAAQIQWMDNDITAAEARGVTHTFAYFHGPVYPMDGHCCTNAPAVVAALTKHKSTSAVFSGHEHVQGYQHIDSRNFTGIVNQFESFISGGGGAGLYPCQRGDYCNSTYGYMVVDVNGGTYTVSAYNQANTLLKSWTFSKTPGTPMPTQTPGSSTPTRTPTPQRSPTPTPLRSPTPTRTPTPNPSITGKPGDANGDGFVNGADYSIWVNHYGMTVANGPTSGDFNRNGLVNGADYSIWAANYGH